MLELIAQGKTSTDRWRKILLTGIPFVLGRTSKDWSVDWDDKISRNHAMLRLDKSILHIEKFKEAANPIFFKGSESEDFKVKPGEHFAIGDTTFLLTNDSALATLELPSPVAQRGFSAEFLRELRYQDADRRISVLNRLPEIISAANDEYQLQVQMVNLLLGGIKSSTGVGICRQLDDESVEVVAWDKRDLSGNKLTGGNFNPCARLIDQALQKRESTLHLWQDPSVSDSELTTDLTNDWAFVCPLAGPSNKGWVIYVAGVNRNLGELVGEDNDVENDLQGDVKFAELMGATLANLRRVQILEQRQSTFRPFFSPVVMEAFVDQDPEDVLKPRQCEISVLFCDLRGFSAKSEQMSDQLEELLDRVSQALGIMTKTVLDFGGVIGDFHGDSAMGFWGWPLERRDSVEDACRAALTIQSELEAIAAAKEHRLHDFQMGIGMATGNAVAGKIGTSHQVKVTAFGPVVNLAARFEGMTRYLGLPILVDRHTRMRAEATSQGVVNFRLLGKFKPFGLKTASEVYQMFPHNEGPEPSVIADHQQAIQCLGSGDWKGSLEVLKKIEDLDPASRFLADFIRNNDLGDEFDGVIEIKSK